MISSVSVWFTIYITWNYRYNNDRIHELSGVKGREKRWQGGAAVWLINLMRDF